VALILAVKAPAPDNLEAPASERAPNVASSVANQNTNKNQSASADTLKLDTLLPRSMAQVDKEDMFKSKSWYIPPPPPPKPKYVAPPPPPPPPPTAPPLPYKFMGSFEEPGQKLVVYLSRGDKLYTASAGDTLEGTYKIESISAGQLAMLYLPLNIRQNLRIGDR
jgi:hypothetical protein